MLWKKSCEPGAVLALLGGILSAFIFGNVAVALLLHAGVRGFHNPDGAGYVLLATLSFHGAALLLGTVFLRFHEMSWREVLGLAGWKRSLLLALAVLVVTAPVVLGLKAVSESLLERLHWNWALEDQGAVELVLGAGLWARVYLVFFAIILAPLAEEFVFRGLLFSTAKHLGWPKFAWLGVSFLFALMHANLPVFVPLFVLALALTWLYEKTDGLLAPVIAHSLFNAANMGLLLLAPGDQAPPPHH